MATQIQLRRDTAANWSSANPVLAAGEIGLDTTADTIKFGDGITAWNSLPTYAPPASVAWGAITGSLTSQTDLNGALAGKEVAGAAAAVQGNLNTHTGNVANPHATTKTQVGLANADNTADSAKPVSTAQAAANTAVQSFAIQRANHTGTQTASTISDFNTAADGRITAAVGASVQAFDADLSAIAALAGTTGLARKTAVNTWSLDTAAYITGNQTITFTGDATGSGTTAVTLTIPTFGAATAGKVPASGGGTTNFLRADGTWAAPAGGGGGGTPGGTTGEIQYNNAGVFAGAANVEIVSDNLKLVNLSADPAASAGGILMYSKLVGGRSLPKIVGPSGIDTILQVGLSGNSVFMVAPANATTAPTAWGGVLTTATTISHQQTIASANPWQATRRTRFQSAATAASNTGMRTAYGQWFRGNAAGFGGFWFRAQFGQSLNITGSQCFVGLCASTAALGTAAGSVSALLNSCGVGYDTTDVNTGNLSFIRNDGAGTATKVNLGVAAARNTTHGYDLVMFSPPNGTDLFVRIVNLHTNVVVLDTSYNTDLPTVNVALAFKSECNNGAVASATNIEVAKVYIESDY